MLKTSILTLKGGRRLRLARMGAGQPLVLLHGYPDNLQIWCELAPALAADFEVLAFDWPGMGYSDPWPGGASPYQMSDRLVALLDVLGVDRAHIVAMDMGGQPALVTAARRPDRAASLAVMNSLVFWDAVTSWEIRVLRKFRWNELIIKRLPGRVFRRAEKTFLPAGCRLPDALRADIWESFRRSEVRDFIVRMCAGYQGTLPALPDLYRLISVPTLVLWAGLDRHFPVVHAERLHKTIPGSRLSILDNAEHWMAWHRAEEVAGRIKDFLSSRDERPHHKLTQ
jgi:pimeloyl-ACP methyl ester carboxylesterase